MITFTMKYSFSDRIKKIMHLTGMKQIPLAQKAGHSQSTINRAINSETIPRFDTLSNIARALDVPVESLTYPDDSIAEIIIELSKMSHEEVERFSEELKKEKLWKHQIAAENRMKYKNGGET